MNGITIYEFDTLVVKGAGISDKEVPPNVFKWLEQQCLKAAGQEGAAWLRLTQRQGHRVIQVTSFVGVIRAADGYQIEVLPKVGKSIDGSNDEQRKVETRKLLINMLRCLLGFRHINPGSANLSAERMPLLEVFIAEFLRTVEHIVKRGLRSDYRQRQGNLFALRGKLLMSSHLRQNLFRADRFFTEYDEFSMNRPENRLLHAALRRVLLLSGTQENQKLARELTFVFADVPSSTQTRIDFQRVRLDRGMGYYSDALDWARLILNEESPLSGPGNHTAPSLLFPMEAVFEAYVAKHLLQQLNSPYILKTQARSHHLVQHRGEPWFMLKPDLLIQESNQVLLVLDTKWKLLDLQKADGKNKYGLSQNDFYQLYAYGLSYLNDGKGDVVLIYPKTIEFNKPLPVFEFSSHRELRLWVLPFCLEKSRLELPPDEGIKKFFNYCQHSDHN